MTSGATRFFSMTALTLARSMTLNFPPGVRECVAEFVCEFLPQLTKPVPGTHDIEHYNGFYLRLGEGLGHAGGEALVLGGL
jgi:hypothetical protein